LERPGVICYNGLASPLLKRIDYFERGDEMNLTGTWREWLYRMLVLIAGVLMVISALLPWWKAQIWHYELGTPWNITIYQWGIPRGEAPSELASFGDFTPAYQMVLAWVYVAASIGLMLWSTWLKGKKGQLLMAAVGLIFAAYAATAAYVVIANRVADFGGTLTGPSLISVPQQDVSDVKLNLTGKLQTGWYLAYITAGVTILLALLRRIIAGKPK
jgi:hypothetical protein